MRGLSAAVMVAVVMMLALQTSARAQVPVLPVFGVGAVEFDVDAPAAVASSYGFKAYVGTRAGEVVPATCVRVTDATSVCRVQLAALKLTADAASVKITATQTAADGEQESEPGELPFVLQLVARPAAPRTSGARVQPRP